MGSQQSQLQNQENLVVNDSTNEYDDCDDDCEDDDFCEDEPSQQSEYMDETDANVVERNAEDQENTMTSDSNGNDFKEAAMPHNYNYHQPRQSPAKSSSDETASSQSSPLLTNRPENHVSPSSSLLAVAALAAVTTNVPSLNGSPFLYNLNTTKFSKTCSQELQRVFDKQQYISNTQRDYLAEKFNVASTQITNWFQNKRRKLKRLERDQNRSRVKSENTAQFAYNAINEQFNTQKQATNLLNTSQNRILIKNSPILNMS